MAGDVRIVIDTKDLAKNVSALPGQVDNLVAKVIDLYAARGETFMKTRAKWHDRTGNARNSLNTTPVHATNHHELVFAHGMNYGIWLLPNIPTVMF